MSLDSFMEMLTSQMNTFEMKLNQRVAERAESLLGKSWLEDKSIIDDASREANDNSTLFMLGFSRQMTRAALPAKNDDEKPKAEDLAIFGRVSKVLIDQLNLDMLRQLFTLAYLRGVDKGMAKAGKTTEAVKSAENLVEPKTFDDFLKEMGFGDMSGFFSAQNPVK